jgi:putative ABC transport system permease protein
MVVISLKIENHPMFRNYFKTAFRNLSVNKVYSIITVAGLGVGISVCLIIFLFIRYQQSFDNFHHNKARIFRVLTQGDKPSEANQLSSAVPFPLPTAVENDLMDWKTTGIFSMYNVQIMAMDMAGKPDKKFKEKDGVFLLEPSFFSIFDFPWLAGDPAKALDNPNSVALSKSTAQKYFGDWQSAMGRTIRFETRGLYTVTGILDDVPVNSDFQLKVVFPYSISKNSSNKDWWTINSSHGCYILLPENESLTMAGQQLKALSKNTGHLTTKILRSCNP